MWQLFSIFSTLLIMNRKSGITKKKLGQLRPVEIVGVI